MGKIATLYARKLKGSTLLESVLALGLMASALSFAVGMHYRILAADKAEDLLRAWSLTEAAIVRYTNEPIELGDVTEKGTSTLRLNVTEQPYAPGLVELTLKCERRDRPILQRRVILPSNP